MRRTFASYSAAGLMSLAVAVSEASAAIPAASPGLRTSHCRLPGVVQTARCGALSVLENPERPDGRRRAVHFAVIEASSGKSLPDPIVVLMGGPGEKAIESASIYVEKLAAL